MLLRIQIIVNAPFVHPFLVKSEDSPIATDFSVSVRACVCLSSLARTGSDPSTIQVHPGREPGQSRTRKASARAKTVQLQGANGSNCIRPSATRVALGANSVRAGRERRPPGREGSRPRVRTGSSPGTNRVHPWREQDSTLARSGSVPGENRVSPGRKRRPPVHETVQLWAEPDPPRV